MGNIDMNKILRKLLRDKGMTQTDLGCLMGLSQNVISDMINGISDVKLSRMERVAEIFEVPVTECGFFSKEAMPPEIKSPIKIFLTWWVCIAGEISAAVSVALSKTAEVILIQYKRLAESWIT